MKLSRAQMEAVRIAYVESQESVARIAERFGVTKPTIYNILRLLRAEIDEQQSGGHEAA